jgi:hypothetical protein
MKFSLTWERRHPRSLEDLSSYRGSSQLPEFRHPRSRSETRSVGSRSDNPQCTAGHRRWCPQKDRRFARSKGRLPSWFPPWGFLSTQRPGRGLQVFCEDPPARCCGSALLSDSMQAWQKLRTGFRLFQQPTTCTKHHSRPASRETKPCGTTFSQRYVTKPCNLPTTFPISFVPRRPNATLTQRVQGNGSWKTRSKPS